MDPPATEPAAAPVSEALSNNNTSENVAEVPEGNASSSAPAAAAEPTAMEVDAPVVETNNSSVPGTKYPKVSVSPSHSFLNISIVVVDANCSLNALVGGLSSD